MQTNTFYPNSSNLNEPSLTLITQICSLFDEISLSKINHSWEKRELSQMGMNSARNLIITDSLSSKVLYLFFLQMNLNERYSLPVAVGYLYFYFQMWLIKSKKINEETDLLLFFMSKSKEFKEFCMFHFSKKLNQSKSLDRKES